MADKPTPDLAGKSHMTHTTYEHMAIQVLDQLGTRYAEAGIAEAEIVLGSGYAVHGLYYSTRNPTKVIHLEAHPLRSSGQELCITAQLQDHDTVMEQRRRGTLSGIDYAYGLKDGFGEQLRLGIMIDYNADTLDQCLREACTVPGLLEQKGNGE
ncbi:hypothetical protein HYU19_03775 [Candidatus Woesearchaeota archaeon]|nr:hypothetical protein [Candidatus Woesearchaeota archaeon]